jgi:hypothetical protein
MKESEENISVEFIPIYTLAFIKCPVPDFVMTPLRLELDEMVNTKFEKCIPYNYELAGELRHEYLIQKTSDTIENFINQVVPSYWNGYGNSVIAQKKHRLNVTNGKKDVWANFQKKYEYNPMHHHSGVLSFVIWCNIPYDTEKERTLPHIKNSNRGIGSGGPRFEFIYPDQYVRGGVGNYKLFVDKTYEGKMIIFNAQQSHLVTPFFTSNDYRISVAGNVVVDE